MKCKIRNTICLILFMGLFFFFFCSEASIIWADHFDSEPDFVCTTTQEPAAILTGIEGGKHYEDCVCNHTPNTEIRIESDLGHGTSGKGIRYRFDTSGDSTQTCSLRIHDTETYGHFFWGFWMKIPDQPIDGADANLKLTRFYQGGDSIIPGINLATGEFNLFWQGASRLGSSTWPHVDLYTVADGEWHYYVQEFQIGQAGDGDGDYFDGTGIFRFWTDGQLILERTNIDWSTSAGNFSWAGDYLSEHLENLNGNFNAGVHDIYFDDVVWATTKEEVDEFLGIGDHIYFEDDFDGYSDSPANHGWTGGTSDKFSFPDNEGFGGSKCVKVTYDESGTPPYWFGKSISDLNLQELYIRFYFKLEDPHGASFKFLKLFGKQFAPEGYANSTFAASAGNFYAIAYGDGSGVENDTQKEIRYSGPHYASDPELVWHNYASPLYIADNKWHSVEVYMRYNSNDQRDGAYRVWVDGQERVHVTNVKNRHNNNSLYFDNIQLANYCDVAYTQPFHVWYDNFVISDRYTGTIEGDDIPPSAPSGLAVE